MADEQTKSRLLKIMERHSSNNKVISIYDCTSQINFAVDRLNDVIYGRLQDIAAIIRPTTQEDYGNLTVNERYDIFIYTQSTRRRDRKIILPYLLLKPFEHFLCLYSASGKMVFEEKFNWREFLDFQDDLAPLTIGASKYHGHNKNIESVLTLTLHDVNSPLRDRLVLPEYIQLCKGKIYLIETRSYKSSEEPRDRLEKQVKKVTFANK